ncbi:metal-dependent protein hydrolase [Basidiobolus meristosporus CBS 931.73]|uniref:Metal-dependent protein hydrolase n=1 Tax=Basidiobolus meristosporus CBS 931.73 TaxID=1314790 RepID=A0A1Y1XTZ5_9FUNG|nr:metal-dependent protein hydrolase [Basidiobolus meristosporus CBS 931.73]|eukprot:ORX89232.1 metal-dependent protein hydrolase [Basidiobolus meristosporus CBS 931.73]
MTKTIGTHNGTFHCDEALGLYLMKLTQGFQDAKIVRTRDESKLAECDAVIDVGGEYQPEKLRFDHHQRGFSEVFSADFKTKLSSAGLIYKHYGKEIIASQLSLSQEDPKVELLYQKMYKDFVEALDAIDNGISQYPQDIEPKYEDRTDLAARVGRLNPWWNQTDVDLDSRFEKAMELAGGEFVERLRFLGLAWLPARDLVVKAVNTRMEVHESGQILIFDSPCPWKEHLFEIEKELNLEKKPIYVLFPDGLSGAYRVQAVPVSPNSFESRRPLPEAWRGYRDGELSEKSQVEGCIFVHHSGFIGGNQTKDGALQMATKALVI